MKRLPLVKLVVVGFALTFAITTDQTQAETRVSVGCTTTALVAAINTANGTPAADTLDLPAGCIYTFSSASDTDAVNGDSALPKITTPITINGNGATIERAVGSPIFRLFYVGGGGNLTLNQTTVRGGQTAKLGAADVRSFGAGILSWLGTVTLTGSTLANNDADYGGGLFTNGGTATVTNSTISGNNADGWGGGIYTYQGTVTVTNSTLSGNSAHDGGGIYNYWGDVTVTNSTLSGNSASVQPYPNGGRGGGIYNLQSTVTVTGSTLSGNNAYFGGGIFTYEGTVTVTHSAISDHATKGSGGGIECVYCTLTVTSSTLSRNAATAGGGIINYGTVTVTDSTISGNSATSTSGGGIRNSGTLTVINSIISGNSATGDGGGERYGGGIDNEGGMVTMTNSTLSDNSARDGGGIYNFHGGTVTMFNSTLSGNSADRGGGGINNNGLVTMFNSTLSGNYANGYGGGIYNGTGRLDMINGTISGNGAGNSITGGVSNDGTLMVTNSIVWGNSLYHNTGTINVTYSIVEGTLYPGTGNLSSDPQFVLPVAHSSAPTTAGDYRLRHDSPAIDAGSNAALPADAQDLDGDGNTGEPVPYDRAGAPRVVNGTVDMGAYEFPGELLVNGDFETDLNDNKVPDGWVVKNSTGDKLKCDPLKARAANCAFKFKGGVGESAKLIQNIDVTGVPLNLGSTLRLIAYFNGSSTSLNAKFILKITFTGGFDPAKMSVGIGPNAGYAKIAVPDLIIEAGTVEQVKVMVKHKSSAGKLWMDSASLLLLPAGTVRGTEVLPPPAAPDGMRGFN